MTVKPTAEQVDVVTRALTGQEHFEKGAVNEKDPKIVALFQTISQAVSTTLNESYAELHLAILKAVGQAYALGEVHPKESVVKVAQKVAEFALTKAEELEAIKKPEAKAQFIFDHAKKVGLFSTGKPASTTEANADDVKVKPQGPQR